MPYDGHHDQTHMQAQKYIGSHVYLAFCVAKNIAHGHEGMFRLERTKRFHLMESQMQSIPNTGTRER